MRTWQTARRKESRHKSSAQELVAAQFIAHCRDGQDAGIKARDESRRYGSVLVLVGCALMRTWQTARRKESRHKSSAQELVAAQFIAHCRDGQDAGIKARDESRRYRSMLVLVGCALMRTWQTARRKESRHKSSAQELVAAQFIAHCRDGQDAGIKVRDESRRYGSLLVLVGCALMRTWQTARRKESRHKSSAQELVAAQFIAHCRDGQDAGIKARDESRRYGSLLVLVGRALMRTWQTARRKE